MAQNITTLLNKTAITAADIAEDALDDYLYIVHGTGSSRSRKILLTELKKCMQVIAELHFQKGAAGSGAANLVDIDGDGMVLSAVGEVADDSEGSVSRTGIVYEKNMSGNLLKVSVKPGEIKVSTTDSQERTVETTITDDGIYTTTLFGNTAVSGTEKKLIIDSTLEVGDTNNTGRGKNLVVNGTATFNDDVKAKKILPVPSQDYVELGSDPTSSTNGGVRVHGLASFNGAKVDAVQEYYPDASPAQTLDVKGGSVIWVRPNNSSAEVDLVSLLSGALVGQRFTVLSEQNGSSDYIRVDIGISGKKWKMTGISGCDFVVIIGGTSPVFRPVGAGQLVSSS